MILVCPPVCNNSSLMLVCPPIKLGSHILYGWSICADCWAWPGHGLGMAWAIRPQEVTLTAMTAEPGAQPCSTACAAAGCSMTPLRTPAASSAAHHPPSPSSLPLSLSLWSYIFLLPHSPTEFDPERWG